MSTKTSVFISCALETSKVLTSLIFLGNRSWNNSLLILVEVDDFS